MSIVLKPGSYFLEQEVDENGVVVGVTGRIFDAKGNLCGTIPVVKIEN